MSALLSSLLVVTGCVFSLLAAVSPDLSAQAQCGFSVGPDIGRPGADAEISAAIHWDPDGAGPQPELLVAAGRFTQMGLQRFSSIAAWDGVSWARLGSMAPAPFGEPVFKCLTVFNGDLIAGGLFTTVDGVAAANIARWNGVAWTPMGVGLPSVITSLQVYNNELYASPQGGSVYRWDGSSWSGAGFGVVSGVYSMAVHAGYLVVAGSFSQIGGATCKNIARWDGTIYSPLAGGLAGFRGIGGFVNSVAAWNGDLIATGSFLSPIGGPEINVARWNGSAWSAMGTFPLDQGRLVVGGTVPRLFAGSLMHSWNGSSWVPMGSSFTTDQGSPEFVRGIVEHQGQVLVVGAFQMSGPTTCHRIAVYTGSAWEPFVSGMSAVVNDIAEFGDRIVASLRRPGPAPTFLNTLEVYDGSTWTQIGQLDGSGAFVVHVHAGELYVGGSFQSIDGVAVNNVARWTGSTWVPVGAGLSGPVRCLASHEGHLIAGGDFTVAGTVAALRVARWDGTTWAPMGVGFDQSVFALGDYQGLLVAGGAFTQADGASANRVAYWTGSGWVAAGAGANSDVYSIAAYRGELILGGRFTSVAGVAGTSRVARWDGATWRSLGGTPNLVVYTVCEYDGSLFVGGEFSSVGALASNRLARWDGVSWSADCSMNQAFAVQRMAVARGELVVASPSQIGVDLRTNTFTSWVCNPSRFGVGCGAPTFFQSAAAPPRLGQSSGYAANNGHPNGLAVFVLGLSDRTYLGVPLPIPLDTVGGPGCNAYCDDAVTAIAFADPTGRSTANVVVPNDPFFLGLDYFTQFYSTDGVGLLSSDALRQSIRP